MNFQNPYSGLTDVKRITTDVSTADYYLIKSMRPGSATITGTLGTLWQKLCNELRKRNISDFTHVAEFEQFVANCTLSCDNSADTVSVDRAELEQLKLDSEHWQQHLMSRSGGRSADGTAGGTDGQTSASNVGGGVTQQSSGGAPTTTVVPDLQSGGRKRRRTQAEGGGGAK